MDQTTETDPHAEIREEVGKLCARFPGEYWRKLDAERGYPTEFVHALTEAGYLAALIPEEYGGAGLPLVGRRGDPGDRPGARAATAPPATPRCTSWAPSCATASEAQKRTYLPKIATGELRLQAFGVTEPTSGTDTTSLAHLRPARGRSLRRQRPEGLDQPRANIPT